MSAKKSAKDRKREAARKRAQERRANRKQREIAEKVAMPDRAGALADEAVRWLMLVDELTSRGWVMHRLEQANYLHWPPSVGAGADADTGSCVYFYEALPGAVAVHLAGSGEDGYRFDSPEGVLANLGVIESYQRGQGAPDLPGSERFGADP